MQTSAQDVLDQAALNYHEFPYPGKISVTPTKPLATPGDLSFVLPYRHLTGVLEMIEALDERRHALQAEVGRQSHMKRTPKLTFELDPAITQGAAIDDALRRLGEGRPDDA